MKSDLRARALAILAGSAVLVSACGTAPAATAPTAAAPTAAAAVPTAAPAATPQSLVVAHKLGETHKSQPKRLESVIEIDMGDHYFGNPQGAKNPTFTLPVGKTVGIHLHNEGTVMHEIVVGRTAKKDGDYETTLSELIDFDVFFYYGDVKAEIGGAKFGEIEVEQGIRDVWLRFTVPAELKGEWELGCFAPEHYAKGMHAKLIFQ
ncbi:MAG TPA: hypothetical protein VFV20_02550 [Candidatus Limnocylindria bacterium]|nr:hypothetical protein [Candidatus Limnocylindria bacterium]